MNSNILPFICIISILIIVIICLCCYAFIIGHPFIFFLIGMCLEFVGFLGFLYYITIYE